MRQTHEGDGVSLRDFLFHEEPGVTLYLGDCREIVPLLDLGGAIIVADPPYGIGHPTNYAARGRDMRPGYWAKSRFNYPPVHGDHEPFDPAWLLALNRPMCLWGANHYASRLPDSSGWLVWDKERPDDLDQATCELAWTNYVKGVRRFRWLWNGMMRASKEDLVHPTQKPLALMTWCLSMKWAPPGVVVDPYMGSGTTIETARLLGREAIGVDVEPNYLALTVNRLRQGVLL